MGELMRHFSGIVFSAEMIEADRNAVISMPSFLLSAAYHAGAKVLDEFQSRPLGCSSIKAFTSRNRASRFSGVMKKHLACGCARQLTMIARALAQGARIFLMDEPATGLDYGNQLRLLEQISKLSQEGYTFVKSTHSPEHALWVANRAILMKDGAIVADGVCDEVINTTNISDLYGAKVNVVKMNSFFQVCIPGAAYGRKEEKGSEKKERPLPMRSVEGSSIDLHGEKNHCSR
jgi:ABC-type multidrug transport system ATPase subunit